MKKVPDSSKKMMDCKDIQTLLLGYMNRELGDGRSVLVREHLRKCEKCQAEAADMQATVALMRKSSNQDGDVPRHLSEERKQRIMWSVTHPALDWIYAHHMFVSVVITLVVLIAVGAWSCREKKPLPYDIYPVYIGHPDMTNGRLNRVQSPQIVPDPE